MSEIHAHLGLSGLSTEDLREIGSETYLANIAEAMDTIDGADPG